MNNWIKSCFFDHIKTDLTISLDINTFDIIEYKKVSYISQNLLINT